MPHAGFLTLLAAGPIRPRTEPTQFRQTIRARLSGDARLGQNSASAALAEGRDRKNVREISRSISSPDRSGHLARLDNLHKMALSWRSKRVAAGSSLARCRASGTARLESENSTRIPGMKMWVTKRSGVVKRRTIRPRAKGTTMVHGWLASIRNSIFWSNQWENAAKCITFHNAVRFLPSWVLSGG